MRPSDSDYRRLLALRTGLRHFLRWSEHQAQAVGITPAQHQLLLAIRGHDDPRGPTVGEIADYLLLRHHSAVGLVDRADTAGLVKRVRDPTDHRVVRLRLTALGERRIEALSALHLEELERLALELPAAWRGLGPLQPVHGFPGSPLRALGTDGPSDVALARVYDAAHAHGYRVLVDRLWPRGVSKDDAPFDLWSKDVAPSTELRKWYAHIPERFEQFSIRYRAELERPPASRGLSELRAMATSGPIVLVTATKDLERSGAAVLRGVLTGTK